MYSRHFLSIVPHFVKVFGLIPVGLLCVFFSVRLNFVINFFRNFVRKIVVVFILGFFLTPSESRTLPCQVKAVMIQSIITMERKNFAFVWAPTIKHYDEVHIVRKSIQMKEKAKSKLMRGLFDCATIEHAITAQGFFSNGVLTCSVGRFAHWAARPQVLFVSLLLLSRLQHVKKKIDFYPSRAFRRSFNESHIKHLHLKHYHDNRCTMCKYMMSIWIERLAFLISFPTWLSRCCIDVRAMIWIILNNQRIFRDNMPITDINMSGTPYLRDCTM